MRKILITDIFGLTDELIELSQLIGNNSLILDPYEGEKLLFSSEAAAYQYFVENVGLDTYSRLVEQALLLEDTPKTLIGFSVGASVIWNLSDKLKIEDVKETYLFYGSQIRNFQHIKPSIPVNIVFPKEEPHFSVDELRKSLSQQKLVNINRSNALHGFMNKLSVNFNLLEYERYVDLLSDQSITF